MAGTGLKTTFVTQLNSKSKVDKEGVGHHRYEDGCWYKYIKYNDGAGNVAGRLGYAVGYFGIASVATHTVTGDTSVATNRVPGGISMSALADGEYGWIKIKGYQDGPGAVTTDVAGDNRACILGTTDGELDDATAANQTDVPLFGWVLDESAGTLFVDCPW